MITGTPYAASLEGRFVVVRFVEGEGSTRIIFECDSPEEAANCISMWTMLIESALYDPANDVDDADLDTLDD